MNRELANLLRAQAHYDQRHAELRDRRARERREIRQVLAMVALGFTTSAGLWWWPPSWFEPAPHGPKPVITTPRVPGATPS